MYNALNNLANDITSDTNNLANLTITNYKLTEKLKVTLSQNKVLTDLLRKYICGVTATQSES